MKKNIFGAILMLTSLLWAADTPKLTLHFFGSRTCGECLEIKQTLLKPLAENYPEKLEILFHEMENEKDFQLQMAMEKEYGLMETSPQLLFFPDTFLAGYENIMENALGMIDTYLSQPEKWTARKMDVDTTKFKDELKNRFREFSFLAILGAGLVDGVNPCAIATMIFLISFLAMKKRERREILAVGLSFTLAVFLTYLLLGIGAFQALTLLDQYRIVSKIIKWSAVVFAAGISLFSFIDAFRYKSSGKTSDIKLQLPKSIKLRIHRVISANLSGSRLIFGAFITGFLVTLLEAVCTGQVYLPTIILMTRESGLKLKGWLYLLFYNFLFVLPLLLIMILAYFGLTWNRLSKTTVRYLPVLKILLGIVVGALAVFLAVSM